ncbi:MAG: hypothetical protein K0Q55_591 [Verrucomicrobia bacterium]|jgi:hypothetical protein|nr:hypothetical protein [Verrucomicrobiota bacterium]
MKALALRKQMLVTESELNRINLIGDAVELTVTVRLLTARARFFGSLISSIGGLIGGLTGPTTTATKPSWLQTALKGVGLISTLWTAFRPPNPEK